jgi:hypothetical protein
LEVHTPDIGDGWTKEEQTGTRNLEVIGGGGDCSPFANEIGDRALYSSQPNPSASSTTEYDVSYTIKTAAVVATDDPFGVLARFSDTDNYYSAGTYGAGVVFETKIFKKVAGTVTQIASANFGVSSPSDGDVMIFKVRDSTDRQTFRNDTSDDEVTADDTALTAAGKCGMFVGNAWVSTDDINPGWDIDAYYWDDLAVVGAETFEKPIRLNQAVNRASVI